MPLEFVNNSTSVNSKTAVRFQDYPSYYRYKQERKKLGVPKLNKPELYAEIERAKRTPLGATSPNYSDNYLFEQFAKSKNIKRHNYKNKELNFIERGPSNVAGRTRAILVMPNDTTHSTWLAGSASGGIWKTNDAGQTWENKTKDLPNLGTNTLAHSLADINVIYAGTGEHFTSDIDGAGMFKSTDGGDSWIQIVDPNMLPDFKNVSRIIVDPNDENIVLATTRNTVWGDSLQAAIYKTIDGGENWKRVLSSDNLRFDDIDFNPLNFNKQYVAVLGTGVLVSTDAGENWVMSNDGLLVTGRIELAVSPVDTNRIWASIQGSESGTGSDLFISLDGGKTWRLTIEGNGDEIAFLGSQGWYDNIITAHPFDANIAYVGGINIWRMKVSATEIERVGFDINDNGAFSFLDFINGTRIGGGILKGENKDDTELLSVELRFGQGSQMAHRFSVNGRGQGVPASEYSYKDLVEVPFQVWDIENNRQLMASFRDQADDGEFSLIESKLDNMATDSREYIFFHDVDYADTAYTQIARRGGQQHEQLYFLWPVLRPDQIFNGENQDASSFSIIKRTLVGQSKETLNISDAYGAFSGNNSFSDAEFSSNTGVHPDQHNIVPIITNAVNKEFQLLSTNDGGVYLSSPSKNPGATDRSFQYAGFGYNTTQFYGADKAPGVDRYVGGMQDNSTWFTPLGATSDDANSQYEFAFGGDGFEAIWNNRDDKLIIGSIQFNNFQRSLDGGASWVSATTGISDRGPFTSRLSNSRARPDRLYTLGSSGVWVSEDFGGLWDSTSIGDLWSFNSSADIEVAHADPDYIWAGGAISPNQRLFVSTDAGASFSPTSDYQDEEMGRLSGIGTHPFNKNKGYALFSFSNLPKVLMTDDLGKSWNDISGFDNSIDGTSTKGFPNVAVNCLLVFPNDTMRIWVGTEIGIVESLNGGTSWELLDANLPSLNVFDFKIQDDQIVIATYGRGIWSVTIEDIERDYIFAPEIDLAGINLKGGLFLDATYYNNFDSIKVLLAEGTYATTSDVGKGTSSVIISDLDLPEGEYSVILRGYKDGTIYNSNERLVYIFTPRDPVRRYRNDFTTEEDANDLFGEGFSVRLEDGFQDEALHSVHPYDNRGDIFYQLKTPWMIRDSQFLTYKDVAFIEVGEVGSQFGDADFYDYVVVEGSKDGKSWTPITKGYDSRSITRWRNAALNNTPGDASFFVPHEFKMTRNFEIGDTIMVRFRLSADPFTTAWGWAIDNLELRLDKSTPIIELAGESFIIYPNPVSNQLFIDTPKNSNDINISLITISGQTVYNEHLSATGSTTSIDISNLTSGIYFLALKSGKEIEVSRIVIEH